MTFTSEKKSRTQQFEEWHSFKRCFWQSRHDAKYGGNNLSKLLFSWLTLKVWKVNISNIWQVNQFCIKQLGVCFQSDILTVEQKKKRCGMWPTGGFYTTFFSPSDRPLTSWCQYFCTGSCSRSSPAGIVLPAVSTPRERICHSQPKCLFFDLCIHSIRLSSCWLCEPEPRPQRRGEEEEMKDSYGHTGGYGKR